MQNLVIFAIIFCFVNFPLPILAKISTHWSSNLDFIEKIMTETRMTQKATTRWRLWICLLNKTSSRVFKKPSAIWAGKVRNTRQMSKERKTVRREVIHRPTDIYPLLFVFILVTHIDPRELFFHTSKAGYVGLTRCGKKRGQKRKKKKRKGEIKMVKRFFACRDARCV